MKSKSLILAASLLGMASSQAAITLFAEYKLGEAGSLGSTTLKPQDSSGNARHFTSEISGSSATVGTSALYAPGSTAYLDTSGASNTGWYSNGLFASLPTNDFAFGIYARASGISGNTGDIFTIGGSNGSYKLSLESGGWGASSHNVAWIGTASGTGFTANTWAHLALIRSGGTTTLYINGVAQSGTITSAPVVNDPHLSVSPGGLIYFDGLLDNARVVTFTSGETTANVLGALTVPEPSAALLGGLGLLALLRRRV